MFFSLSIVILAVSCNGQTVHPKYPKGVSPVPFTIGNGTGNRIIGGEETAIEEYPFAVSIQYNDTVLGYEVAHFCGGSIISEEWILTTSLCALVYNASDIHVRVGSNYFYQNGTIYGVESIIAHPRYDENLYDYDLALLKLSETINFGSTVQAASLPSPNRTIVDDEEVVIAGWGLETFFGDHTKRINHVKLPKISDELCATVYGNSITERMFCAYEENKGPCIGDTGTPVLQNGVLVGMVSWSHGCALTGFPSVYANIPQMVDWITEVTGIVPTNGAPEMRIYSDDCEVGVDRFQGCRNRSNVGVPLNSIRFVLIGDGSEEKGSQAAADVLIRSLSEYRWLN